MIIEMLSVQAVQTGESTVHPFSLCYSYEHFHNKRQEKVR